jgi:hypothetical protein
VLGGRFQQHVDSGEDPPHATGGSMDWRRVLAGVGLKTILPSKGSVVMLEQSSLNGRVDDPVGFPQPVMPSRVVS